MANFITHREWCEFVPFPTTTNMWEHTLLKTAKPNECTRGVDEIQTLKKETFKSALAYSEASIGIFFNECFVDLSWDDLGFGRVVLVGAWLGLTS